MKINFKTVFVFILVSLFASYAHADPLKSIAKKMAKKVEDLANKKVAVLNFPYHNGYICSGSSIVQERLTTFLTETGKVEVVERNLLDKILQEMSLEVSGVIDEKTTKELGKVLGVSGLVTGTLNDISSKKTEVNARIIHVETGKILAASRTKIKRTWTDSPVKPDGGVKTDDKPEDFSSKSLVQLAVLLDTSGSMQGLIHQARTQLWKIVNGLASSEKEGDNPVVQVALYEYGNSRISADENYIRQILPFTTDLDQVSEKLFSLTTNGGQEYCGAVIMDAVKALQWDKHSDVYKVIFVAGNEPFTQGPVDFREAVKQAVGKDIFVNTVFCGNKQQGIATKWKDGADFGNGEYLNIDQRARMVAIQAPQDEEIRQLGTKLNETFIFYGGEGKKTKEKQAAQDERAQREALAGAPTERAMFKAKAQYSRSVSGDLVNDLEQGRVELDNIETESLPPSLQKMDKDELKKHVESRLKDRKEIQDKMNKLSQDRQQYIARKREQMASQGEMTLDEAILNAVRSQAIKKKFKFKE